MAKRVIQRANGRQELSHNDQLTNPAGPCSFDSQSYANHARNQYYIHPDYKDDCFHVCDQYNLPYVHQTQANELETHSNAHYAPYHHPTCQHDQRFEDYENTGHQERITFAKTAPTGFGRYHGEVNTQPEMAPVMERLHPVRRDNYLAHNPLDNSHNHSEGLRVQEEAQRLLRLNQDAIMTTGEFKRSGQYL